MRKFEKYLGIVGMVPTFLLANDNVHLSTIFQLKKYIKLFFFLIFTVYLDNYYDCILSNEISKNV